MTTCACHYSTRCPHATKYGPKTAAKVERTMREFKRGKLKSSGGKKVTSRKQAIAIGLSQARAKGYKVPMAHAKRKKSPAQLEREILQQELEELYRSGGYAGLTPAQSAYIQDRIAEVRAKIGALK